MDTNPEFVILPSSAVDAFLSDNGTNLKEVLAAEGIEIDQRRATDPAPSPDSTEKDAVTIIIASAAVAVSLVPALSRVLSTLMNKPIIVKEMVLIPVEDSSGHVIKDSAGNPRLQWVERTKLLESKAKAFPSADVKVEGPIGLKFSYKEHA